MPPDPIDAETLFLDQLPRIERLVDFIRRRNALTREDAEDFASIVKLKLVEDDYAVLRKYRGESRLDSYLTMVVHNLFRDFRNERWGKYRPTVKAKELGEEAVLLERLLVRDGLGRQEAIEYVKTGHRVETSREELQALVERLPVRIRRRFVGDPGLDRLPSPETAARRVVEGERTALLEATETVVSKALEALSDDDFLLLKMHYRDGLSLAQVARRLNVPQRPLYTRRDRSLRELRRAFDDAGLAWDEVRSLLGWERTDMKIGFGEAS